MFEEQFGISCSVSKGTLIELLNMVRIESTLELRLESAEAEGGEEETPELVLQLLLKGDEKFESGK